MRPIDVVRRVCPRARPEYLAAFEAGDQLFAQARINTPDRLAQFLAQVCHETGGLTITYESGDYSAQRLMQIFGAGHHSAALTSAECNALAHNGPAIFERVYGLGNKHKHDLGNTQPGDGWKYRGAGLMQTTGRANYARMGRKCGVDFETHPEWVLSAAHALKPAIAEWSEGGLNAWADKGDIEHITRKINGGLNGFDSRKQWFRKIRPLIDKVDLRGSLTPVSAPADPAPVPTPAPTPTLPPLPHVDPADPSPPVETKSPMSNADKARHAGAATSTIGGIWGAINAETIVEAAAIIVAVVLVVAAIYFLKTKRSA